MVSACKHLRFSAIRTDKDLPAAGIRLQVTA